MTAQRVDDRQPHHAAAQARAVVRARADRLLHRPERAVGSLPRPMSAIAAAAGRWLLGRTRHERLVVVDARPGRPESIVRHGSDAVDAVDVEIEARVTVHDERAYAALVHEGSIGLGRGYIEGWWTTDDPVAVVRFAIRNIHGLDRFRNRVHDLTGWATDRIRAVLPRHTRERNRDDISAHYDLGNDFFELFLDETMTYSSAVFPHPEASLAEASRHKYDRLLGKLGVRPGDRLLEIGTGWGGMAIHAAGEWGAHVTTTTISSEQLAEARRRVADAGLGDRVELLDSDWRDLAGEHDHVVSIEMIEAVDWREYADFFSTIERCLAPGGRAAIQAICLPDERWDRAKNTEDFIRRFVFPNGFLPSVGAIRDAVASATSRRVVDVDDITPHYVETLRRWRATFDERLAAGVAGLDERFERLWRFYLAYCEAGFAERHVTAHQILIA